MPPIALPLWAPVAWPFLAALLLALSLSRPGMAKAAARAGVLASALLAGEIDHDAAQGLRIQLDDALLTRSPRILVMDLGGVGFMDSSGIGLILGRQRCARTLGGSLRIQHAPEQLRRVLQLASIPCTEPGGEVSGGI